METSGSSDARRRRFDYRGLFAYLVLLSFFVMLTTGIIMFMAPSGRVAREVGWALMGLGRSEWQTLHLCFAIIFIASGFSHLACNWRGLLHHLRDRASHHLTLKWEAALALCITFWLLVSATLMLPPADTLHDMNEYFRKTFWVPMTPTEGPRIISSPAASANGNTANGNPAKASPRLPKDHPPISAEAVCSDCHQ
jgi:hypothetical protein